MLFNGFTAALMVPPPAAAGSSMTGTIVSSLESTAGATTYSASAFTPQANSFLVAFVAVATSTVEGSMSGGSLTWTKQGTGVAWGGASQHRLHCFTAEVGGSPASTTPVFDCTGDAGAACLIAVVEFTGLHATEIAEVATANDLLTDSVPEVSFAGMNTTEFVVAAFASADASDPTGISAPSGWSGYAEYNQLSPACALGVAMRNTGESSAAISFTADGDATDNWACVGLRLTPA